MKKSNKNKKNSENQKQWELRAVKLKAMKILKNMETKHHENKPMKLKSYKTAINLASKVVVMDFEKSYCDWILGFAHSGSVDIWCLITS